ncbi:MAG: DsrE family protein [Bacteroidetes bacterium]|nr:DsrE family protein [Bacteroidota bacterium]
MTLGILVNTDKHAAKIAGIANAAIKRGHKVIIFFMDDGCRIINDGRITSLKDSENITMSLCDLNRRNLGMNDKEIPQFIRCGSQYDNALMHRSADKIVVF